MAQLSEISGLALQLPILLFSVIIHEYAHGWTAEKFGDPTARVMGRLTLNPGPHIDPFGTIFLPLILLVLKSPFMIGWAKPVPVNFQNLKNPKKNILWVGISGPVVNIILAAICGLLLKISLLSNIVPLALMLSYAVQINIILAVFNLTPIPPLDGSRFVYSLLPDKLAYRYASIEPYGFLIIMVLLWIGILDVIIWPIYEFVMYLFHLLKIL